jgi:hypothetical protein
MVAMGSQSALYSFETYRAVAVGVRAAELAETTSPFQIEVRFIGGLTDSRKSVFSQAADRWARVVVGDLETAIIRDFTGEVAIDDLLIDAEGVPIDGLEDLGYTVDLDAAQPYALPDLLKIASSGRVPPAVPEHVVRPTVPTRIPAERP